MTKRFIRLTAALLLVACSKTPPPGEIHLVVEGWIENGGHPIVQLTETFPVEKDREITAGDLIGNLAKWAKVTVDDGDQVVTLTGMVDRTYFPPYVFTTGRMTGEVGKTYRLRVEYKDYVATAETTIPAPVPLDTVYVASVRDSLCHVVCGFTDPPERGNCYKFFTRTTGIDSHYHPSALAQLEDSNMDGYTEIFLYSTQRLMDFMDLPNIHQDDELWVKMCTMDMVGYRFWDHFESMLVANMFDAFYGTALNANIHGALGYWIGYGVDKEVRLKLTAPEDRPVER